MMAGTIVVEIGKFHQEKRFNHPRSSRPRYIATGGTTHVRHHSQEYPNFP